MTILLEYDRAGDILEASVEGTAPILARDIGDDVWIKVDALTGAWRGFIVLNATKRTSPIEIPLDIALLAQNRGKDWIILSEEGEYDYWL